MDSTSKRKVTAKVTHTTSEPALSNPRTPFVRAPSPLKPYVSSQASSPVPAIRPKSKVNSTATSALAARKASNNVSSSVRTYGSYTASTTPRAVSPIRPSSQSRNVGASSSTFQPKARSTVGRTNLRTTAQSTPTTPISHHRSLTMESSGPLDTHNITLQQSSAYAVLNGPPGSEPGTVSNLLGFSDDEDEGTSVAAPIKIKAKLTRMAKSSGNVAPSPVIPSHPRPLNHRSRAPSLSSTVSMPSTPPTFYPITTATAAANPHRYASSRQSPPASSHHHYQPFTPPYDDHVNYNRPYRIDPVTVPLPPHSPPGSAVSFSSRSSLSRSSVSYATDSPDSRSQISGQNGFETGISPNLRPTLDNLVLFSGVSPSEESFTDSRHDRDEGELGGAYTEERKVKAEAKSIRKIADLEITNRSLLAINASLETAKHRQAKEIRDLRRKLRESRLILPPRAYRAVKSSLDHDDEVGDEDEDEDEDEEEEENTEDGDDVYKRIKAMLETLIEAGKRALATQPDDFCVTAKSVAKVLHADEVKNWRDSTGDDTEHGEQDTGRPVPSPPVAVSDNSDDDHGEKNADDSFRSEDEVEAMTLPRTSPSPSPTSSPSLVATS